MLMTASVSDAHTGSHPEAVVCSVWSTEVSPKSMRGMLGPQRSVSMMPTVGGVSSSSSYSSTASFPLAAFLFLGSDEKACANNALNVLFPTPPLPLKTMTLCFTPLNRSVISGISGSGPFGAVAHIFWFGQPTQASPFPACSDSGPGQCSGSGASSLGRALRFDERASEGSCVTSASSVGAMIREVCESRSGRVARKISEKSSNSYVFQIKTDIT